MSRMRAVFGPTCYEPMTRWGLIQALLVMIAAGVLAAAMAAAVFLAMIAAASPSPLSEVLAAVAAAVLFAIMGEASPLPLSGGVLAAMELRELIIAGFFAQLLDSLLLAGAAWWMARRGGMRAVDVLAIRAPTCGGKVLLLVGVVAAACLAAEYAVHYARYAASSAEASAAVHRLDRAGLAREAGWPLAVLTMGIVGPVAEEIWFRGFLLPALARTWLGFWGAGLVTSALFAALHGFQYSLDGVVAVFFSGLVFVWALGLTGSLWVPIAIHMCFNLLALLSLWLWP